MAATPFAEAAAYMIRTGQQLTANETVRVATWLADASAIMRAQVVDLDANIESGLVAPVVAEGVCVRMVERYLTNPTGASSKSETSGPFSESLSWTQQGGRMGLYLTAEELVALSPVDPTSGPGSVGTVRVGLPIRPRDRSGRRAWRT